MVATTIRQHMTVCPHTIGAGQKLSVAHRLMRDYQIRHLPVLDQGQLVGILSQRDLYFIETLKGVDPDAVTVEEAMSAEPFTIDPEASVERVAREMAANKYGAAVVIDGTHVVGVFTTTDALKALSGMLANQRRRPAVAHRAARKVR
jgi:acetoin utilization protein AcuB